MLSCKILAQAGEGNSTNMLEKNLKGNRVNYGVLVSIALAP